MDILTYVDSDPFKLYPTQRFVLKLMYGLPISSTERIEFEHPLVGIKQSLTEKDYLSYLYDQGRCSIARQEQGYPYNHVVLAIGRRAGKTTLSAKVVCYAAQQAMSFGSLWQRYGLPENTRVNISAIGSGQDQAGILRDAAEYDFRQERFAPFLTSSTRAYYDFTTPTDRLRVAFLSAQKRAVHGSLNLTAVFDEMAFYSDDSIYNAILPTMSNFSPKSAAGLRTGEPSNSLVFCISTPNGKRGQFQRLCRAPQGLMLRIPTWEMNPSISRDFYRVPYRQDPQRFLSEYGAEFVDTSYADLFAEPALSGVEGRCVLEIRSSGEHSV